ncbi:MAG: oligosaccharide flippase family protein [Chloroflexi bacterium]|nr:oligosaccharide flippase family protein [Chloroflexota bacterium]
MSRRLSDVLIAVLLFALPLVLFWQQTLGGRTLLPTENLYQYEPYATYREVVKAPAIPHNALLSDLVLQNMQWKEFIRQSIAAREIPLWNPHQFAGIPFLAAGQQSALYPFSILYYVLPLTAAYGWFTVVQLWLAGVLMFLFLRGLGIGRFGALVGGVVYQLNGFFIAHAVFPMIVGAAVWLPLILLMIEFIIRQKPMFGRPSSVPWVIVGAAALGCNVLAGHVEITYYTLLIAAYYAAARLVWVWWRTPPPNPLPVQGEGVTPPPLTGEVGRGSKWKHLISRAGWLVAMVALGLGLGAVQFIPLFEFASLNYRDGRTTLEQVLGWAHPLRDVVQFALPNFYGNPSHHAYFDVFTGQTVPATVNALGESITTIDWGIKNYVEGALYLGILPLALAAFGLVARRTPPPNPLPVHGEGEKPEVASETPLPEGEGQRVRALPPYRLIFALLALAGLTFMFGLPTYALLHYGLPGFNQLHSPFRWIFAVTFSVAALAGFGAEALTSLTSAVRSGVGEGLRPSPTGFIVRWARRFGWALMIVGGVTLIALLLSRLFYPQIEPLVERIFQSLAGATKSYADARMFYSYQFTNVLTFGVMTLGAGVVFWRAAKPLPPIPSPYTERGGIRTRYIMSLQQMPIWQAVAIGLVALDLMIASWGFNPASDPALLHFTPPAIQWLQQQQTDGPFRYITLDDPTKPPLFNANMTWRYGLYDVRGYESIIPRQYVEFMQQLAPQTQLDYNRIAPLYTAYPPEYNFSYVDALKSPLLGLLNVRYVITHKTTTLLDELTTSSDPRRISPAYRLAYEDEAVRIWEHGYAPRAWVAHLKTGERPEVDGYYGIGFDVTWGGDTGREKILHANLYQAINSWLIVSETYLPGWRAFVRPRGGSSDSERPLEVERVFENFQGVNLSPDVLRAAFQPIYDTLPDAQKLALDNRQVTVRLVYSPASFQVGLFGSFISGVVLVFMAGVWVWRLVVRPERAVSGAAVVAKNSLAPIILNLFNRGIDFGFAFIMLRILGPEGAGIYYYAAFIFGWFDIFTNFGLNVFLTREVARDRTQAWRYLFNTSVLRLALMLVGVALLAAFLAARQSLPGSDPLTHEAVLAIILLYIGLFPNTLSTGLSALFYAFEKAEIPAAVTTVATINKAVFGVAALAAGFGVVGLASVSIVTNVVTLAVLAWSARGMMRPHPPATSPTGVDRGEEVKRQRDGAGRGEPPVCPYEDRSRGSRLYRPDFRLMRGMIGESWPLMLNHFLATIFFQVDVVIIEAIHGARMVGQYSVAYKWVAALNVIPAFFTMALLPVMSRQAHENREALRRNYRLAIKLLVSAALPLAVVFTFLAYVLTGILGGAEYLPDGAIATQLMIWSIPIGWMNSLTQYVLIALDLQRRITRAFFIAVTFNIVANLLFVPEYGYRAAALATIASEAVLLLPFALLLRGAVGSVGWLRILVKPLAATGVMLAVFLLGWNAQPVLTLIVGTLAYLAALLALRPLDADEWSRLLPLLPARLRRVRAEG